ncbi:MAG TPA: ATP-binding cassette domain-containing protein [Desulfotomaculum sp.]|nr:ATP-binding cassette domain-containing protein [Desulfotomaculum sp.]
MGVLEIKDLYFTYGGSDTPALNGLSLRVDEGEFFGITGPTGAGKTTLACCINGLIPHFYRGRLRGRVLVFGEPVGESTPARLARSVGSVFQDAESQVICADVEQEVAFGLENMGFSPREMEERIQTALELVGLSGFRQRPTAWLSGGEKQRLAIAAALAPLPRVLVLDEPTSELDPLGTREIFQVLRRLNREMGMTIIIMEQKTDYLAAFADRMLVLEAGRAVLEGSPAAVMRQQADLDRVGVRVPDVARLALMLGIGRDENLPLTVDHGRSLVEKWLQKRGQSPFHTGKLIS